MTQIVFEKVFWEAKMSSLAAFFGGAGIYLEKKVCLLCFDMLCCFIKDFSALE